MSLPSLGLEKWLEKVKHLRKTLILDVVLTQGCATGKCDIWSDMKGLRVQV